MGLNRDFWFGLVRPRLETLQTNGINPIAWYSAADAIVTVQTTTCTVTPYSSNHSHYPRLGRAVTQQLHLVLPISMPKIC